MITRHDIVMEARRWMDVPFVARGRSMSGLDCNGLLAVVAHNTGCSDFDFFDYVIPPQPGLLVEVLGRVMTPIPVSEAQPGDAVCMIAGARIQHAGILSDIGVIHTYQDIGKVSEHRINDKWRRTIRAAFVFPGVT